MRKYVENFISGERKYIDVICDGFEVNNEFCGLYQNLAGIDVVVYTDSKRLFVLIDSKIYLLDDLSVFLVSNNKGSTLKIVALDQPIEINYTTKKPVSTLTYSEDELDTDFGFWIKSLKESKSKQSWFIEKWSGRIP